MSRIDPLFVQSLYQKVVLLHLLMHFMQILGTLPWYGVNVGNTIDYHAVILSIL